jgi:hypothetical protein
METHSQQELQWQAIKIPHQKNPSISPPSKNLASSFRESFISSGKQGGGAIVLGEGARFCNKKNLCSCFL